MTIETRSQAAAALDEELRALDLAGRLRLVARIARAAVFTTSLGIEDQVITAVIGTLGLPIR
ncbi:MAG TPA: phosphoadenosine phosphosulfate reductase, partial [Pararhizobium sp.]|nr:phosphoadenosine phosphosulfate reductase [Pararhizobium sp.]